MATAGNLLIGDGYPNWPRDLVTGEPTQPLDGDGNPIRFVRRSTGELGQVHAWGVYWLDGKEGPLVIPPTGG